MANIREKVIKLFLVSISICFSLLSGMSEERGWQFISAAESAQIPLPRLRAPGEDLRGNWRFMPYEDQDYLAPLAQSQADPDPAIRELMRRFAQNIQDEHRLVTTTSSSNSASSSSSVGSKRKREMQEDKVKEPDEEVGDASEESRPAKSQRRLTDREIEELLKTEMSIWLTEFTEENLRIKQGLDRIGILTINAERGSVPANLVELLERYFPNILKLTMNKVKLRNIGFKALAQSKIAAQLKRLSLYECGITAQGFTTENLNKFKSLDALEVTVSPKGDAAFEALAQSKIAAQLKKLQLWYCRITAQGFTKKNLNKFESLETLGVVDNPIGNAGFEALAQSAIAARLKELRVEKCEITAQGFTKENLNKFKSLERLNVANNQLDGNAISVLTQSDLCLTLNEIKGFPADTCALLKNNCLIKSR